MIKKLKLALFDDAGVVVERGDLPVAEAIAKVVQFMLLHGTDPDKNGKAARSGHVEFQPIEDDDPVNTTFVCVIDVVDRTGKDLGPLEVRQIEGGALVGLDAAYLAQLDDDEHPFDPYASAARRMIVPDDEEE